MPLRHADKDKLCSLVDHYGLHDVLLELAVCAGENANRLRIVNKQNPRAKLWEYMSELIVRLTDDDIVMQTRHTGKDDSDVAND